MRLYLVNPTNPLVSIVNVRDSRWNRYRVWKPLSLMVLAGLTPAGMGHFDPGREPRRAALSDPASARPRGHYGFHLAGEPRL